MFNKSAREAIQIAVLQTEVAAIKAQNTEIAANIGKIFDRLDDRSESQAATVAGLDNRYALKEGCNRGEAVTRREVTMIAGVISLVLTAAGALVTWASLALKLAAAVKGVN